MVPATTISPLALYHYIDHFLWWWCQDLRWCELLPNFAQTL